MRRTRQPPSAGGKERRKHVFRMRCILTGLTKTLLPWKIQSYSYQSHCHFAHVCQNNYRTLITDLIVNEVSWNVPRDFAG